MNCRFTDTQDGPLFLPPLHTSLPFLLQTRLEDAKLCVRDCHEASPTDLDAELDAAESALEAAAAAYLDVLDGLREHQDENDEAASPSWEEYRNTVPLKALRAELDKLRKAQASTAAATTTGRSTTTAAAV